MPPTHDTDAPTSYQFTDYSVTRPTLTRFWFERLFRFVPRRLPANFVTLLSCGSLLAVLDLSLAPHGLSETAIALVFFAALQVYVAGDHLDGMQAVASRTASPLGDFLDHYCDLWAGCILIFGFWSLLHTAPPAALYASTVLLIAAFATTYTEREMKRELHFASWGALEANLAVGAFFLSWAVPAVRGWWRSPSPAGVPWYAFAIAVVAAMGLGSIVVIVRRMGKLPAPLLVAIASLGALALLVTRRGEFPPVEGSLLLAAFGGEYVARVMHGYLAEERSWPDPVAGVAIAALLVWDTTAGIAPPLFTTIAGLLGAYLLVVLAVTVGRIIFRQRRYWVWRNATVIRREPVLVATAEE